LNFFDHRVAEMVADRIERGADWGGIVKSDRVYRSLLSSQTVCFNAFGYLARHDRVLVLWLRAIGLDATSIEPTEDDDPSLVRIEYAPPRKTHLDSGSAFDACITYRDSIGRRCVVAIETKYAEKLSDQKIASSSKYATATTGLGHWKATAAEALNRPEPVQCWQNVLLLQKAVEQRTHGWEAGTFVMVADGHDLGALRATAAVWGQLIHPTTWVRWAPYQQVVDVARADSATADWCDWFTTRYLDLRPIADVALPDANRAADVIAPRGDQWAAAKFASAASGLVADGDRCVGIGSVIDQLAAADLGNAETLGLVAAAQYYENLVEPLREARRLAAPIVQATLEPSGDATT
jgi:hypothetical protein